MSFRTVIWTRNRWIYWNRTFLGLAMANLVRHNINKKSWDIMMKLGAHVLRSPGRSTWSLWSWSRCQMKDTLEIFIISKDRVLSLINCPFTSRRIFQTLRMWFSGSNFGRSLPYKYSSDESTCIPSQNERSVKCLAEYSVWPILASDRLVCLTISRARQTTLCDQF